MKHAQLRALAPAQPAAPAGAAVERPGALIELPSALPAAH
jgi:hypothetical protein